jgi:asparagine synthase (glutamine-hydrolysing)
MCGINVVISLKRNQLDGKGTVGGVTNGVVSGVTSQARDELRHKLMKSLDIISHRGPDAQDVWINTESTIGI